MFINYFLKKSQLLDYNLLRKLDSKQRSWKNVPSRNGVLLWSLSLSLTNPLYMSLSSV